MPIGQGHTGKLLVHDTATGRLLHKFPFQLPPRRIDFKETFEIAFSTDGQVIALNVSQPTCYRSHECGKTRTGSYKLSPGPWLTSANYSTSRKW